MLIDGPTAYSRADRFNRVGVLSWLPGVAGDEFLMIGDDSTRPGESLLVRKIMQIFAHKGCNVERKDFVGAARQTLLMTPRFQDFRYL